MVAFVDLATFVGGRVFLFFHCFEKAGLLAFTGFLFSSSRYIQALCSRSLVEELIPEMPLHRPRANSLELSIERLRITTWCPTRPPTPRRSTYPRPGTTSRDMPGAVDLDIPPVPSLSYWEPETPSPMSPYNPFLSPPAVGPVSPKTMGWALLSKHSLSVFDKQTVNRSWSFAVSSPSPHAGNDQSPRFLNPRTPPLPPITQLQNGRRHSIMCSVPSSELDEMKQQSLSATIAIAQGEIGKALTLRKERGMMRGEKSWIDRYNMMKKFRKRRNQVKMKSVQASKQVSVEMGSMQGH